MSDHPRAGGRYFREKDGTLTRARPDGSHPNAGKAAETPAPRAFVKQPPASTPKEEDNG